MQKLKQYIIKNTRKHPYISIVFGVVLVIIIGIVIFGGGDGEQNTIVAKRTDFKKQVSVSGRVVASLSSELGFEQGGKVATIYTPVGTKVIRGQAIASTENSDVEAEVLQKQANLEREMSKLDSVNQGTRPEQLTIDQQSYKDTTEALVVAYRLAYLDIESTLSTKIDTIFTNGGSVNPNISVTTETYETNRKINNRRLEITEKMKSLKLVITELESNNSIEKITQTQNLIRSLLNNLKNFNDDITVIIQNLHTSNSGLSQTVIDTYKSNINTAGTDIADSTDNIQTAETEWNKANNSLSLSKAGSTKIDINTQNAVVKASQADLLSAKARLAKTIIYAPFNGVITRMDLKLGEIVSPNLSRVSIMSVSTFEIESFVPEVHIADIKPGNTVRVTLDAYGTETIFNATVKSIDQAETVKDGVSTYKVVMTFDNTDDRIRSGMTANAVITTLEKSNAIVLPQSAVVNTEGIMTVGKIVNGNVIDVPVEIGSRTSLGQIEITDGINEGDTIILKK